MQALTFFFAFVAVLALIGVAAWLVRRFAGNRLGANTNRGRMPRLAVIDAAAVDGRRRLVLVRRDNVEHLLMIGGPTDIVVEPNIVRAMPGRDQLPPRPAVGAMRTRSPGSRRCPTPPAGAMPTAVRADVFDHPEPQMPEPPPRPVAAVLCRRSAPPGRAATRANPAQRARAAIRWPASRRNRCGGRPEPRPELRGEPMPSRVTSRNEPMMPRPLRPSEARRSRRRFARRARRRRRRRRRHRRCHHRLRRCRRRTKISPRWRNGWRPRFAGRRHGDRGRARRSRRNRRLAARAAAASRRCRRRCPRPRPKSGFENLEDEMASLLGRPKTPS